MTRVLHVIDQRGRGGEPAVLRLSLDASRMKPTASQGDNEQHAWLLLGGEPLRDAADAVGIDPQRTVLMARPKRALPVPRSGNALNRLLARADRVECWTHGAATAVGATGCDHFVPRFGQATLCGYAQQVIEASKGNDLAQAEQHRGELRERWGATPGTTVVGLLIDHPERIDAMQALLAAALTREALVSAHPALADLRLVCHPLLHRRMQAAALGEMLHLQELLVPDAQMLLPWSALAGCDIALATESLSAGLSVLWADALGVPVIACDEPRLPLMREMGCLIHPRSSAPKHFAHELTTWVRDHATARAGSRVEAAASAHAVP